MKKMQRSKEIIRQLYSDVISEQKSIKYGLRSGFCPYATGLEAFNRFFAAVNTAFPDCQLIIENMVVKGDRVMVRYAISGTHMSDFMGVGPTNERMSIIGIDVFRLAGGRVVEHWDAARQMTALPRLSGEPVLPAGTEMLPTRLPESLSVRAGDYVSVGTWG